MIIVFNNGEIFTNSEFISMIADRLKLEHSNQTQESYFIRAM